MLVAERGHGVSTVQIENLSTLGGVQEDALGIDHVHGVLGEYRREPVRIFFFGAHVHPAAGAVKPAVSGRSNRRFIH